MRSLVFKMHIFLGKVGFTNLSVNEGNQGSPSCYPPREDEAKTEGEDTVVLAAAGPAQGWVFLRLLLARLFPPSQEVGASHLSWNTRKPGLREGKSHLSKVPELIGGRHRPQPGSTVSLLWPDP